MAIQNADQIKDMRRTVNVPYGSMSVSAQMCLNLEDKLDTIEKAVDVVLDTVFGFTNGIITSTKIMTNSIVSKVMPTIQNIETSYAIFQKMAANDAFMNNGIGDYKRQYTDADGNPQYDDQGQPIMETVSDDAWCEYTWECEAILKQLLDDSSVFYNALMKTAEERCWTDAAEKQNFFDHLNNIMQNYDDFHNFICNMGFAFNFSIDLSKYSIKAYLLNLYDFKNMINKLIAKIEKKLNEYLEWLNNCPIIQYLNEIKDMFECVFGELDCSAIWTAQGLYERILLKCHITQHNDGTFQLDPAWRKQIFAQATSVVEYCNDLIQRLMKFQERILKPVSFRVGAKVWECGNALYPGVLGALSVKDGQMKITHWRKEKQRHIYDTNRLKVIHAFYEKRKNGSNVCPENDENLEAQLDAAGTIGSVGISIANSSEYDNVKKEMETKDEIGGIATQLLEERQNSVTTKSITNSAVKSTVTSTNTDRKQAQQELDDLNKVFDTNRYCSDYIINNMRIESNGLVYVDDGCCTVQLNNLPLSDNQNDTEFFVDSGNVVDNRCILDPETDNIVSATDAAIICATDPTRKLSQECKLMWELINNKTDGKNIASQLS